MPRFVGREAPQGAIPIKAHSPPGWVRLSYAQMRLLPPQEVRYYLDRSDRGGPRRKAKRWYRWFATIEFVLTFSGSTESMKRRARVAGGPNGARLEI